MGSPSVEVCGHAVVGCGRGRTVKVCGVPGWRLAVVGTKVVAVW